MRNTLLTTTALVLTAGIASADGHATVTWSGTATAGFARDGAVQSKAVGKQSVVWRIPPLFVNFSELQKKREV